jgi:hypothetical protein
MHIKIKSNDDKNINLIFPHSLVLSNLTAVIAAKAINKKAETRNAR